MIKIKIYRYSDSRFTRSILRAECIAELEVDELPDDLDDVLQSYAGDFLLTVNTELEATL